jgi:ubiquinone/menaquinone biosynthesis C-methylase UbiE
MAWGLWRVPESSLQLLGDVRGRDVLELGCGAARWSAALARAGARAVGVDVSPAQLARAAEVVRRSGEAVRLVRADAERLPFGDAVFDIAFSDWGALTFCDPHRSVPEAARVLRPGARLVFSTSSPFRAVAHDRRRDRLGRELLYDYFGLHRLEFADEVNFQLSYGGWIRLFRECAFEIQELTETRPGAGSTSTYLTPRESRWARRWPLESIWQLRKTA